MNICFSLATMETTGQLRQLLWLPDSVVLTMNVHDMHVHAMGVLVAKGCKHRMHEYDVCDALMF